MLRVLYKAENTSFVCISSVENMGAHFFLAVLCHVHGLKLYHYMYCLKEMSINSSIIYKPSQNMFN